MTLGCCSSTTMRFQPRLCSMSAVAKPAGPPPTIKASTTWTGVPLAAVLVLVLVLGKLAAARESCSAAAGTWMASAWVRTLLLPLPRADGASGCLERRPGAMQVPCSLACCCALDGAAAAIPTPIACCCAGRTCRRRRRDREGARPGCMGAVLPEQLGPISPAPDQLAVAVRLLPAARCGWKLMGAPGPTAMHRLASILHWSTLLWTQRRRSIPSAAAKMLVEARRGGIFRVPGVSHRAYESHTQKVPVRAGPGGTDDVRCVLPVQPVSRLSLSTLLAMSKAAKDDFTTPTLRKLTWRPPIMSHNNHIAGSAIA